MNYTTDGIVISSRRYSEADRLLSILTKEKGRISAIAKSVRKPNSRLRGATEPFVKANFEIAAGKTLDIIRHAEILDLHMSLRDDWKKLQLAGHLCEIAQKFSVERVPDIDLYELLENALDGINRDLIGSVVLFKSGLLEHMGVFPDLGGCVKCGSRKSGGHVHLDIRSDGFLCSDCASNLHVWHPVPMKTLHLLNSIVQTGEIDESVEKEILDSADDILTVLLQVFLQASFKTVAASRHARNGANLEKNMNSLDDDIQSNIEPES